MSWTLDAWKQHRNLRSCVNLSPRWSCVGFQMKADAAWGRSSTALLGIPQLPTRVDTAEQERRRDTHSCTVLAPALVTYGVRLCPHPEACYCTSSRQN
jgi:hypothetical protein